MSDREENRKLWDEMTDDQRFEWLMALDSLESGQRDVLKEIPSCPEHGEGCLSHYRQWIITQRDEKVSQNIVYTAARINVEIDMEKTIRSVMEKMLVRLGDSS